MKVKIDQFLQKLEQADALDQIQGLIVGLRDATQVDHIVYHWVSSDGEQYGFGTYDPKWVQHYVDKDYLRVDPVVLGCFQRFHPVDWKRLDWSSRAARAFRKDAIDHGVGNQGFSVPIRGPNGQFALFTLSHTASDEDWAEFAEMNQRDIILIAHFLNQKALEIEKKRAPSARFKLGALNTTHAVARAISEGLIVVGGAARQAEGGWPGREENATAESV